MLYYTNPLKENRITEQDNQKVNEQDKEKNKNMFEKSFLAIKKIKIEEKLKKQEPNNIKIFYN